MEDSDSCTTELFLREDRVVEFGQTDGPQWTAAAGTWQVEPNTDNFTMMISRRFEGGVENSDMGEFGFDVDRTFSGEMTMVGASVAITGIARCKAAFSEEYQEVGYFNMIDATDERIGVVEPKPQSMSS